MANLTVVLTKPGELIIENRPLPKPRPQDVQIRIRAVGLCGSDVHYWHRGYSGRFVVKAPLVLGHEASGEVTAVGSQVTKFKPGDRVAIEPGVPCRHCDLCKAGRYNLCPDMQFCATPPVHGTLCHYYCHPADFCFKMPPDMSFEAGALLEPLTVAVYSCERAQVSCGSKVVVLGSGPIGLVSLLVAKAAGATHIAITDVNEGRLEVARQLGATSIHCVTQGSLEEQVSEIHQGLGGEPTACIECCGAESSIQLGLKVLGKRGIMVTVGRGSYHVSVSSADIISKELDIRGIFRYANGYAKALALLETGQIDVEALISHRFTLQQTKEAFEMALSGQGVKVMVNV